MTITPYDRLTTVICPTSPSPCHPSTRIIDETLRSVRHWFSDASILVLADGVRRELEHRRQSYSRYLNNLWNGYSPSERSLCDLAMCELVPNTHVYEFIDHHHQTAMVKEALPQIKTPLLLWIEQDQPIRTDVQIDWQMMTDAIMSGSVDLCRLMLHEGVHSEHEYLYQPPLTDYPHLRPQRQWSGWVHLASTDMYRRLLRDYDPRRGLLMVERYVGRIIEAHPWSDFKLTSYVPDPVAARRIYHLHGRGGVDGGQDDPTFAEQEIYR
jgi:hypothetical protein